MRFIKENHQWRTAEYSTPSLTKQESADNVQQNFPSVVFKADPFK